MEYYFETGTSFTGFYKGRDLIFKRLNRFFFFDDVKIIGNKNEELLIYKSFRFFFSRRIRIIKQNLENVIELKNNIILINENELTIRENLFTIGRYKADLLFNNKVIGNVHRKFSFSSYNYEVIFLENNDYNYYFMILCALFVGFTDR